MKKMIEMKKITSKTLFIWTYFIIITATGCGKDNKKNDPFVPTPLSHRISVQNPGNNNDIKPAIESAFNLAVEGDTVIIPDGTFTFTGTINITKKVSIRGGGMSKTILYRPESISDDALFAKAFFNYNIWSDNPCGIKITDLTLKSQIPCEITGDGGSLARDFGFMLQGCIDFVVTRCRFENFGEAALFIKHRDNLAGGVIFKCEFYHNMKGPDGLDTGYGVCVRGEDLMWVSNPYFGTSNFIFIEDNIFDIHRHSIASSHGALYVARHNTITNNRISFAIDMHGVMSEGARSARASEIYLNQITLPDNIRCYYAIRIRGGESLIHDNTIQGTGYRSGIGVYAESVASDTNVYPKYTQTGYLSALNYGANHTGIDALHANGDLFIWNNSIPNGIPLLNNVSPTQIIEDRDYHLVAKPEYVPYTYPHPLRQGN